jgi:molecular chaperone GrpE
MENDTKIKNDLNATPPSTEGAAPADAAEASPAPAPAPAEPGDLSPGAFERLQTDAAKAREHWDRLLRTMADFDNYKKRVTRERQEAVKYAYAPLLEKLIPVLDHFDKALDAARNATTDSPEAFHDGITMICQQLRTALTEAGLEEINAVGQPFDPNWHEAVSQQPTTDVPDGQVTQQLRKGYRLRDRLLRPASVVVAKSPAPTSASEAAETASAS